MIKQPCSRMAVQCLESSYLQACLAGRRKSWALSSRKYGCWQHHHGPLLAVVQKQLSSRPAALLFAEFGAEVPFAEQAVLVLSAVPVPAVGEVQPFEQEPEMMMLLLVT